MKKFLVIAASAIVALTACSKTDATYLGEEKAIGFNTNIATITKTSGALASDVHMGVHAQINGGDEYFNNIDFWDVENNGIWTAKPAKLYPNSGSLKFTFYAPYNLQNMKISSGKIEYDVPEETDFLYGATVYVGDKDSKDMAINLKHAMAQVLFNVSSNAVGVYKITKITLNKVSKSGKIVVDYNGEQPTVVWTPNEETSVIEENGSFEPAEQAAQYGKSHYIVPSDDNGPSSVSRAKNEIIIEYTMNGIAAPSITKKLEGVWNSGRRYAFNIHFTSHPITFKPTVDIWIDESTSIDIENNQ